MPSLPVLFLLLAFLAPSSAAPAVIRLQSSGACAAAADPAVYDRPVIGIVTHPGDGAAGRISNGTSTSYIGASYVKFVEAGGARVIPLIYNEPEECILEVRASRSPRPFAYPFLS
jgi:gamma-glutamyl hydrolase